MQIYSKGFTAPSRSFPGATTSVACERIWDGDQYIQANWATNVFAADGGWVDHAGCDNVQYSMDAFIAMLSPFYDGTAAWTDNETGEQLSFWQMILRTLPDNLGPPPRAA
jgi:hypothetical protein